MEHLKLPYTPGATVLWEPPGPLIKAEHIYTLQKGNSIGGHIPRPQVYMQSPVTYTEMFRAAFC